MRSSIRQVDVRRGCRSRDTESGAMRSLTYIIGLHYPINKHEKLSVFCVRPSSERTAIARTHSSAWLAESDSAHGLGGNWISYACVNISACAWIMIRLCRRWCISLCDTRESGAYKYVFVKFWLHVIRSTRDVEITVYESERSCQYTVCNASTHNNVV